MSTQYIHQWAIALGFDASAVEKGIAQTTKIIAQASDRQRKAAKPYEDALKAQNSALKEQIRLRGLLNTATNTQTKTTSTAQTTSRPAEKSKERATLKESRREDAAARRAEALATRKANMQASINIMRANANKIEDVGRRSGILSQLSGASENIAAATSQNRLTAIQGQQLKVIRAETHALVGAQKKYNDHLAKSKWLANGMAQSVKNMVRGYASVFAGIAAASSIFQTAKILDSIKASMLAGSGSAEMAAKNFEYVRAEAKRLGLDLESTAKSYGQLSIAARQAGLPLETTREIFEGVTEASTAFGLSSEDNEGVLRALTQMLSKNVISAEELRGQMGDRMPIAMGVMAKALKMSTKELDKQMRSGNLIATEVLPKWARQMKIAAREGGALGAGVNTITAAQNRLNTVWTEAVDAFSGGGGKQALVDFLDMLSSGIQNLIPYFAALGNILSTAMKVVTYILEPIGELVRLIAEADDVTGRNAAIAKSNPESWQARKALSGTLPKSVPSSSTSAKTTNINTINFTSTKANAKEVRKEVEDIMQLHWTGMAFGPA